MLNPITLALFLAGGAAGGFLTYGFFAVKVPYVVNAAIVETKKAQIAICDDKIRLNVANANGAAEARIKAALEAGEIVKKTPEDRAELKKLCAVSASCRERGSL